MRRLTLHSSSFVLACVSQCTGLIACSAEPPTEKGVQPNGAWLDAPARTTTQPLLTERRGGIAERAYFQYSDAAVALRSYAAVTLDAPMAPGTPCSATMIGPNTLLTAGHCGGSGEDKVAIFLAYSREAVQRTETYDCEYLLQLWPEIDTMLYWCFPNNGVNPGDKWGYADFDIDVTPTGHLDYAASRARLAVGAGVYSIWMNDLRAVDNRVHHIYSRGVINASNWQAWYNPGGDPCSSADDYPLAIDSSLWSRSGASGSSQYSTTTHRIAVGATTGATDAIDGAPGRDGSAIADLLFHARLWDDDLDPSEPNCGGRAERQINTSLLQTLWNQGIRIPGDSVADYVQYIRWMDDDLDGRIDLQHDLELSAGVSPRDFYMLGFESHQRNAYWSRSPATKIHVGTSSVASGYARVEHAGGGWHQFLRHPTRLSSAGVYRLRYTVSVTSGTYMAACIGAACRTHYVEPGSPRVFVDRFTDTAGDISFWIWDSGTLSLRNVSAVKETGVMDFDTHDQRLMWGQTVPTSHPTPAPVVKPGLVWPNGTELGSSVDWAGIVRRPATSAAEYYNLWSHQLGIGQGEVRVCFEHSRPPNSPGSGSGVMRLRGVAGSEHRFTPGLGWQELCTDWMATPSDDNTLEFGSSGDTGYAYAVDNLTIERR